MTSTSIPQRKRLTSEASRAAALLAARQILTEAGPQGVTLKAVATRVGRTHGNLIHHFGSAAGLHQALIDEMATSITAMIDAVRRDSDLAPHGIVDLAFSAFANGGAGALASWMILSGNEDGFDLVLRAIHGLGDVMPEQGSNASPIGDEILQLVLLAFADALVGPQLSRALGVARNRVRDVAFRAAPSHLR